MNAIWDYYDTYDEESRLVKDNYHYTEFSTTVRWLEPYLTSPKAVLEVGAGTGRYSCWLAERGHGVTALDVTPKHVDRLREKAANRGLTELKPVLGDARDLSAWAEGTFDAVLCLGPLYHLADEEDRRSCIAECLRVLRPGGILAVGYVNRAGVYLNKLLRNPDILLMHPPAEIFSQAGPGAIPDGCFVHSSPGEMETFMASFGIRKLGHAAADGIAPLLHGVVNDLEGDLLEGWLDYQFTVSDDPYQLGTSLHNLFLAAKPDERLSQL
ncbi:class I SAM-dependent methyltransferase [Gorillibacterium sp. sgz500922]|uniref:class I SAM-dependent methyltransferase n=1 Tax=Gorillibacterium sp. sgz500922 TaxID=3446694 RepID=UPI003F678BBA